MDDAQERRDDFVVRIGQGPDGELRVRVVRSPAGEGKEARFEVPFTREQLESLERRFAEAGRSGGAGPSRNLRPLEPPGDERWAEAAGEALFRALLPEELLRLWRHSVWTLHQPDAGRRRLLLRLRFDLDDGPAGAGEVLHRLPWELLYDPEERRFLATSRRFSVARYLEVPRPRGSGAVPGRPKVLAVAASPRKGCSLPPLDLSREVADLRRALGAGFELRVLENASLSALGDEMRGTIHVLHFMGHGDFDPETGQGALVLEDEDHGPVHVTTERLIEEIGESLTDLRLVVLNACRTAEAASSSPYAGVATALVARGVGAVVAMRHPIRDEAALAFSKGLYEELAERAYVDAAVQAGRRALRAADRDSAEWAVPALFLRSLGGPLVGPPWRRWVRAAGVVALVAVSALGLRVGFERGDDTRPGLRPPPVGDPQGSVHRLPLGEPVPLPGVGAVVTAERVVRFEQEMIRLVVAPDRGESMVVAVFEGDTAEVPLSGAGEGGELLEIQVLTVDRAERTVAVRAWRRPVGEAD